MAARVVAQGAQLSMFLFAARVLEPSDFGMFALVAAVSTLLYVLGAAGWREFILGWGGNERAINQAITYSFLSGYILTAFGVACGAVVILVYKEPLITALILTLSGTILLAPVTHTLSGILVRRGDIARLSLATIIAELAGLAAGVAGLVAGWNIVALGVSKLVMQLVSLICVTYFARWPIKLVINGGFEKQILEFSRAILATRIVGFFSSNVSTFIIGAFLGVASVGYFRAAERVISAISELLFEPLRLISWMVFRQAADRADNAIDVTKNLTQESHLIFPLLILCAAPIFTGTALISEDIVSVLLGERWLPAAPVLTILAFGALLTTPIVVSEPLLTINGKVKLLPPVSIFNAVVTAAIFLVFTQFGLIAAALARLAASAVMMITALWLQIRHADAPWWGAVKQASPVYTGLVALIIAVLFSHYWLTEQGISIMARFAIEVTAGVIAYLGVIFLVRPSFIRTTFWL